MRMRSAHWVYWDVAVAIVLVYLMIAAYNAGTPRIRLWRGMELGWPASLVVVVVLGLSTGTHIYSASRYWRRWRGVKLEEEKRLAQVMYTDDDGNPEAPCGLHRFDEHTSRYCHLKRGSAMHIAVTPTVIRHMSFVRPAPTPEETQREWLAKGATGPHLSPRGVAGDGEVAFEWQEWQE